MQGVGIDRCIIGTAPKPVFFRIGFDKSYAGFIAPGIAQIPQSLIIDWEKSASCAVFGSHISDGGTVCQWQAIQTFAIKFNKLADHAFGAEHFHHFKHQIRTRGAFHHGAGQLKSNDFGDQH